jgi:hypothetical protein
MVVSDFSDGCALFMPTLFKFLGFLAVLGGLAFGGMVALVAFVEPQPREMVEVIPPSRFAK